MVVIGVQHGSDEDRDAVTKQGVTLQIHVQVGLVQNKTISSWKVGNSTYVVRSKREAA